MRRAYLLAIPLVLCIGGGSQAQQTTVPARPSVPEQKSEIRVQVNINFFVTGAVGNTDAAMKSQEDAPKALYRSAAHECEVLQATIAAECRIESVNVNINRNYGQPQNEGFTANGNFGYRITPK